VIQDNELYEQFRVSSDFLLHGDTGSAYLEASKPGTYTVYLYNSLNDYYYSLEAYATIDVIVPYPDENGDGIIDISDIVKYLAVNEYDHEAREEILNWINPSHKAANLAPTINNSYIFDPHIYMGCTNYYRLDSMFNDENPNSLIYSIVGNVPESIKAAISGGIDFDVSTCSNVWQNRINYSLKDTGTSTITVRATDEYGLYADREVAFFGYDTLYYDGSDLNIRNYFHIDESENIFDFTMTVVANPPKDIGSFVPNIYNDGSLYLRLEDINYIDDVAMGFIKVDVTTMIGEEPGSTYTHYFKIIVEKEYMVDNEY
jgi:hypothetical protein